MTYVPIPEWELIVAALAAIAAEPRPWTARALIDATTKAGGFSRDAVAACLYMHGTDGY